MQFEELDDTTRRYMLDEFDTEETGGNPYRSKSLSPIGLQQFPTLLRSAIQTGNEQTLIASLGQQQYWNADERYLRNGQWQTRRVNYVQAAERLGQTEFSTWYVRGLAKRLLDEGESDAQIYRAAQPRGMPDSCSFYEGQHVQLLAVYNGHRAQYWPRINHGAFSVPFGPNCHHLIRRIR